MEREGSHKGMRRRGPGKEKRGMVESENESGEKEKVRGNEERRRQMERQCFAKARRKLKGIVNRHTRTQTNPHIRKGIQVITQSSQKKYCVSNEDVVTKSTSLLLIFVERK